MTITNRTLVKIASIGGIITCSTGMLLHQKIKDRIREAEYYKEAFKTLRAHKGAVTYLGEPIKEGRLNIGNSNNYCDALKAHFEIPVKGPLQKGTMYFWAKRATEQENWIVNRIELGLKNEADRRLLIRDVEV